MADSASVVVAAWGLGYKPYVARWWESVRTLNRKPDEIVLATNLDDPCELLTSVPEWADIPIVEVQVDSDDPSVIWQKAAEAASKEWIVGIGIDDQYHPQGLDFLESVEGDLVIDNCQFLQGGEWIPSWNTTDTHNRRFAPAGISPFRRNLLPLLTECNEKAYWNDWFFYLLAVKQGVKVYRTQNYRMIHDLGNDHQTMSGVNSDSAKRAFADDQLNRLRAELEL